MLTLNCDLGEGYDDSDIQIMPYINQANIACGGHTGDAHSMARAVTQASMHNVAIGAHPSYPDQVNFGRSSLALPNTVLYKSLMSQVTSLQEICAQQGLSLQHIKAHGALYNDSMKNTELMDMLLDVSAHFDCKLIVQALPDNTKLIEQANKRGVHVLFEAFSDRAYCATGHLVARTQAGAVHTSLDTIVKQALAFAHDACVRCNDHSVLNIQADTLCVHGDNPQALAAVKAIYNALH